MKPLSLFGLLQVSEEYSVSSKHLKSCIQQHVGIHLRFKAERHPLPHELEVLG